MRLPSVSLQRWVLRGATITTQTGGTSFLRGAGITLAFALRLGIPGVIKCMEGFGGLQLATRWVSLLFTSPALTSPRQSSRYFASARLLCSHNLAKFGCYVIHSNAKFDERPHPVFQFLSEPWGLYHTEKSKGREPPLVTYYTLWIYFHCEKCSLFQKAAFHLLPPSYWFHRWKQ